MPRAHLRLVQKGMGYCELASEIAKGGVLRSNTKILVMAIGRSDVLNRQFPVLEQVQAVRQAVDDWNPAIIMLLVSPVLWLGDGMTVTHKLGCTTPVLKAFCSGKPNMEFSRATQGLVGPDGINPRWMGDQGYTVEGLLHIKNLIVGKINCGKIRQKYFKLKALQLQLRG